VFLNFYSGVGGLILALWVLVFILRGWGLRFGKNWIAGVEQCSRAVRDSYITGGCGGWVGFEGRQNDLSQTPHMDTESVD